MAFELQLGDHLVRQCIRFHLDAVRQELVVKPATGNDVFTDLPSTASSRPSRTIVMIREPPGVPRMMMRSGPSTKVGDILESMPLARFDRIGLTAHQSVGVGDTGLDREIVHFIIQQHAGTGSDEAGTER